MATSAGSTMKPPVTRAATPIVARGLRRIVVNAPSKKSVRVSGRSGTVPGLCRGRPIGMPYGAPGPPGPGWKPGPAAPYSVPYSGASPGGGQPGGGGPAAGGCTGPGGGCASSVMSGSLPRKRCDDRVERVLGDVDTHPCIRPPFARCRTDLAHAPISAKLFRLLRRDCRGAAH